MAPVSFLFQKKGVVRVAVEEGDDFDARLERLIDTALNARAEDFDLEGEPENGLKEIEVGLDTNPSRTLLTGLPSLHACQPHSVN